jgi:hypothetical protein
MRTAVGIPRRTTLSVCLPFVHAPQRRENAASAVRLPIFRLIPTVARLHAQALGVTCGVMSLMR